jgi:16S rRNA (guanine527-N7)-methyltransferase
MQLAESEWLSQQVCRPLGIRATADQIRLLLGYTDLLQRWNETYNLTAVRDRSAMLTLHLADCLAALPPLSRHLASSGVSAARLFDVGSGGGLPGALFAILLPALAVTCIDTVGKKAAFVRQVAGALALPNLHSLHGRVEACPSPPFDVITSRAFASLSEFTRLTRGHLAPGGVWMAMKGKPPHEEIEALPGSVEVFHVEQLHVPGMDAERCLVWMKPRPALTVETA